MIQPTLINLHRNEYSQEFYCYPFSVKLGRCVGSCNTLNKSVPNKREDLNLNVFNMITGINESKTLTKDISFECKCKFDGANVSQINCVITVIVDVSVNKFMYVKKIMFGILPHIIVKNGKYLANIMEEIIDDKETNFNKKQSFFILLSFLLITITLLFLLITFTLLVAVDNE